MRHDDTMPDDAELVAELNDLLQLDQDAVGAYTLAIQALPMDAYRETLTRYRADHERHVAELRELIRAHGGTAVPLPHLPTGVFKLAVQALGDLGDLRSVLAAFKTNEGQVRDKYRRHADRLHPPEVDAVLRRAAADEEDRCRSRSRPTRTGCWTTPPWPPRSPTGSERRRMLTLIENGEVHTPAPVGTPSSSSPTARSPRWARWTGAWRRCATCWRATTCSRSGCTPRTWRAARS